MWKYVVRLLSSVCASFCSAGMFAAEIMSVVSSANVYTSEFGTVLMMSLMYRRKNVVDSVLPCGMPSVMILLLDIACCVCVVCCLFWKYDAMNVRVFSVKLNWCLSLCSSLLCDIVSYALDRSTYIASTGVLSVLCL